MRVHHVILAAILAIAPVVLPARQEPVYRADIQTVPVYVTVLGSDGRLVTDLAKDAFEILDNGRPQPITLFDNSIQPISIVVMLDMSGSMSGNVRVLRSAAVQMFTRLLPKDKARVGSFGDRIIIAPDTFTNDVDTLTRALWFDLTPGGPTPLWGAVNAAMTSLANLDGRRVVLVLTDGKNTGLRIVNGVVVGPTQKDVTARATTEDFMVYAIGMRSQGGPVFPARPGSGGRGGRRGGGGSSGGPPASFGGSSEPDPGLREVASATGGGYFALPGAENLGPIFAQVADELHHQYLLGYVPPEVDGKVHRIDVRMKDPAQRARARQHYLAALKRSIE